VCDENPGSLAVQDRLEVAGFFLTRRCQVQPVLHDCGLVVKDCDRWLRPDPANLSMPGGFVR
jgi:hypothetical protein